MERKGGKHQKARGKRKRKIPRHPRELVYRAAFARLLTELRIEPGNVTQERVAEKSGYTPQYISDLEQRKYTPTIAAFGEIVRGMGIVGESRSWERLSSLLSQFAHLEVKPEADVPAIDQDASTDPDREVRRRIQAVLRKCSGERLLQVYEQVKQTAAS